MCLCVPCTCVTVCVHASWYALAMVNPVPPLDENDDELTSPDRHMHMQATSRPPRMHASLVIELQ